MIIASAVPTIQVLTLHLDNCNRLAMIGVQCSVWLRYWAVGHILCYLFQMILQTHRIDINHFIPYHEQELIADVPSTKMETQLWMSEEQHITCRAVSPSQCRAQECSMFKREWCRVLSGNQNHSQQNQMLWWEKQDDAELLMFHLLTPSNACLDFDM